MYIIHTAHLPVIVNRESNEITKFENNTLNDV